MLPVQLDFPPFECEILQVGMVWAQARKNKMQQNLTLLLSNQNNVITYVIKWA